MLQLRLLHLHVAPCLSGCALSFAWLVLLLLISSFGGPFPVPPFSFGFRVVELLSAFIPYLAVLGAVRFLSCPLCELLQVRLFVWIPPFSILEARRCG